MSAQAMIGFGVIALLTIGILYLVAAVSRWVHPIRVSLFDAAQEIIEDPRTNQRDRQMYNAVLDHACSFRAGWLVPRSLIHTLGRYVRNDLPDHRSGRDLNERQARIMGLFAFSTIVANPIALLCSIPLALMLVVIGMVRNERPRAALTADTRDLANLSFGLCKA